VAAELNRRRRKRPGGVSWDYTSVRELLTREILTGTYLFGFRRNNLGKKRLAPAEDHVRVAVMDPIIPQEVFQAAREKSERTRRRRLSNDELMERLRRLWAEKGYVTHELIRDCPYLPAPETFYRRFGRFENVRQALGYNPHYHAHRASLRRIYTDDALLDELRRIHRTHGYLSLKLIDADPDSPRAFYFRKRFGGLLEAYKLLGVTQRPFMPLHYQDKGAYPTREEMLSNLAALLEKHGYLTTELIREDPSCPSAYFYSKTFGGLAKAYALVGYCVNKSEIMSAAAARRLARISAGMQP
jgi:hypothetical protein